MARSNLQMRLVTAAAGVATIVATSMLTGCGTGQVAATARITAAVPGGNTIVKVPAALNTNSAILVQNATIDYSNPAGYPPGGDAPLSMFIVNQTPFPVVVTPGSVTITIAGGKPTAQPAGQLTWTDATHQAEKNAPPAPAPSPSESGKAGKPGKTGGKASASPTEQPTPTAPSIPASLPDVAILSGGLAVLSAGSGQYLEISGLTSQLTPGDVVTITLTFKVDASKETNAEGQPTGRGVEEFPAVFTAPVGPPTSPAPRVGGNG